MPGLYGAPDPRSIVRCRLVLTEDSLGRRVVDRGPLVLLMYLSAFARWFMLGWRAA